MLAVLVLAKVGWAVGADPVQLPSGCRTRHPGSVHAQHPSQNKARGSILNSATQKRGTSDQPCSDSHKLYRRGKVECPQLELHDGTLQSLVWSRQCTIHQDIR